jgi:hypothetical protein
MKRYSWLLGLLALAACRNDYDYNGSRIHGCQPIGQDVCSALGEADWYHDGHTYMSCRKCDSLYEYFKNHPDNGKQ